MSVVFKPNSSIFPVCPWGSSPSHVTRVHTPGWYCKRLMVQIISLKAAQLKGNNVFWVFFISMFSCVNDSYLVRLIDQLSWQPSPFEQLYQSCIHFKCLLWPLAGWGCYCARVRLRKWQRPFSWLMRSLFLPETQVSFKEKLLWNLARWGVAVIASSRLSISVQLGMHHPHFFTSDPISADTDTIPIPELCLL